MSFYSEHKNGIIGSGIFHLIILILLIFYGFFTPFPLPGEEGILVNFGDSPTGLGIEEPSPANNNPLPPPSNSNQNNEEITPPPASEPEQIPSSVPETQAAEEEALTQDIEETASIDAAERARQEEIERQRQEELERQRQDELERQRQEELERQRQEEIERQRQEELERQRQAELERQRIEEEQRRINEINSLTRNAFENTGDGSGGTGTGDGQSQGVTFPGGNQGVPTGSPDADSYGEGGSGFGDQGSGSGISYSLSGRSATSLPKPNYPGNEQGVVVVQVTVDKNGNVTNANAGFRGSNTMNPDLLSAAQRAAMQAKFNVDNEAPVVQQGTITYRFILD